MNLHTYTLYVTCPVCHGATGVPDPDTGLWLRCARCDGHGTIVETGRTIIEAVNTPEAKCPHCGQGIRLS